MTVRQSRGGNKTPVSVPLIAGAVVLMVILIGVMAYRNFAPGGPVPVKTATSDWLEALARKSGGDINKLSPAEQARLNQIPMGGGAQWLKRKYDSLH